MASTSKNTSASVETGTGKYLYAIIPASADREYGDIGIGGAKVYLISDDYVAAVVSDFIGTKIRPERRHIAAHQTVLKRLMEEISPLPISFGVIADAAKDIRRILTLNRKSFLKQIQRVEGKVEMGVRVVWDVPNIFEYFVNSHEELRLVRDQYFSAHHTPSQSDKMELGRLFDRTLQEEREKYAQKVEENLKPCCAEIKSMPVRGEKEVLTLACLVAREKSGKDFEAAICEAARDFDNNYAFDFNGPWAPHNFVDVELEL